MLCRSEGSKGKGKKKEEGKGKRKKEEKEGGKKRERGENGLFTRLHAERTARKCWQKKIRPKNEIKLYKAWDIGTAHVGKKSSPDGFHSYDGCGFPDLPRKDKKKKKDPSQHPQWTRGAVPNSPPGLVIGFRPKSPRTEPRRPSGPTSFPRRSRPASRSATYRRLGRHDNVPTRFTDGDCSFSRPSSPGARKGGKKKKEKIRKKHQKQKRKKGQRRANPQPIAVSGLAPLYQIAAGRTDFAANFQLRREIIVGPHGLPPTRAAAGKAPGRQGSARPPCH